MRHLGFFKIGFGDKFSLEYSAEVLFLVFGSVLAFVYDLLRFGGLNYALPTSTLFRADWISNCSALSYLSSE